DALRGATDGAHVVGLHAQNHALLRDDEQLVAFVNVGHADDVPVAIAGGDVDDADAAPRLDTVLVDFGALPVSVLGHGQQRASRADHFHRHHVVVVPERDPADTVRGAPHRTNVAFLEPDGHAGAGADEDFARPVGNLHGNHGVAVLDPHRDDA